MIDWYDKQACHLPQPEKWDRTNGRIYKISYNGAGRIAEADKGDLSKLSDAELVKLQAHDNDYFVRHARRILQERQSKDVVAALQQMVRRRQRQPAKRLPRDVGAARGWTAATEQAHGRPKTPYVRAWTIQLACEGRAAVRRVARKFAKLAKDDPSPVVRLYLASALQRIEPAKRWDILKGLVVARARTRTITTFPACTGTPSSPWSPWTRSRR